MLKTMIGFALATTLLTTLPASADRDRREAPASGPESVSTQAMAEKLNDLGYDVRRLESEERHFEAHMVERKSGGAVKARFDRKDGELIHAELDE